MGMTSMKMSKEQKTEGRELDATHMAEMPNYPYGLKIHLEDDQIEALGFRMDKHKVGETGELTAKFSIESMESLKTDGGEEKRVCLQITDLGFTEKEDRMSFEGSK